MKEIKKIIGISICLSIFFTLSTTAQLIKHQGYIIKGTFNGLDSGVVRMLSEDGNVVTDSDIIVNGKFILRGKIGLPEQVVFNISPGIWSFRVFVENTSIALFIDTIGGRHYGSADNKWAIISETEETGSEMSDIYERFKSDTHQKYYTSCINYLREKLHGVKVNADTKHNLNKEIDSLNTILLSKTKFWIENYVNQNPSSIAGVFLFSRFYQLSPDHSVSYLNGILNKFSGLATSSIYFKDLKATAAQLKNIQSRSIAPDFTLLKRDKSLFKFSSTRGKYTLLDFWASWYIPCRKEIPDLKIMYSKYRRKGLNIVSISNDRYWKDWTKALDEEKMPWIQVVDEFPDPHGTAKVSDLFGIKACPFYVLIDKEGKVILSSDDEVLIKKKIEKMFN